MPKVKLVGYLDIPADRYETVMAALPKHIDLTRAEIGCISFEVTPCKKVKGRLNVNELFVDQEAFDQHQLRTKDSAWADITKGLDRHYSIYLV